jgi:hypothetical protein
MLVHEACRKQRIVTKNSTEAELVALSDYIDEGTLLEDFIMELRTLFDEDFVDTPQVVFQDNKSTIELVEKGGGKPRTKYMKVRSAYMTERLSTVEVSIRYTHTSRMVADVLTKPLQGEAFHRFAQIVLGRLYAERNRGAKGTTLQDGEVAVRTMAEAMSALNCAQPQSRKKRKESEELGQKHYNT